MARRSSFSQRMAQYQRELERQARAREQAERLAAREAERARKEYERAVAAEEKESKRLYLESRIADTEARNEKLESYVESIEGILSATLAVDDFIDFEALKVPPDLPPFQPGPLATREQEPVLEEFLPPAPSGLKSLLPGVKGKHEQAVQSGREAYERAVTGHAERDAKREQAFAEAKAAHELEVAGIVARAAEQDREVDTFRERFNAGDPEAVVEYFSLVLTSSGYPEGFPQQHKMAFVPESKQLVIEYELPDATIAPRVRQYKYVRARDAIEETSRPASQIKALYAQVIAQTTLRSLHEIFEADRSSRIETIVFNGFVSTLDPATGRPVTPHLITLRATKDAFTALDLARVDPLACLKGLNASVSKNPTELVPVRPVLDFNMVDPRFVQESDILGTLDQRPNLMALSPKEFESLITNLFEKMGLEARQTQASRDGGVDCVAYDPRPIFGGKVIIQAKRYKHTVGVSAVRDLYGTLQNEGASKGILVTTSGYGKSSFEFADGKPLELLSGSHLLYLLAEHAGVEARIEPPEDWVDPATDTAEEPAHTGSPSY